MKTTQHWHDHAGSNMSQAQNSHAMAATQCRDSRRAHDETVSDKFEMYNKLNGSLEEKVNNSRRLLETLQQRAESLKHSIKQTRQSLVQVEAAYNALEAPLHLCLWRIEKRKQRPQREHVLDIVEEALEGERRTLLEAQQQLGNAAEDSKGALRRLEAKLTEVKRDIDKKAQALAIDEKCLRTTQASFQTVQKHTMRPPIYGAGMSGTASTMEDPHAFARSADNETLRHHRVAQLEQSGGNNETAADALREENDKLIVRCKNIADAARTSTERAVHDRIDENQQVRRRLENEIQETDTKISETTNTISETRFHLECMQEPMALNAACTSMRRQRVTHEHIVDPVSATLDQHEAVTYRAHQELAGHHESEKYNRYRLWARKQQLKDDMKDKTTAHDIDQMCLARGTLPAHSVIPPAPGPFSSKTRTNAIATRLLPSIPLTAR